MSARVVTLTGLPPVVGALNTEDLASRMNGTSTLPHEIQAIGMVNTMLSAKNASVD
jgi:hypothetical protein